VPSVSTWSVDVSTTQSVDATTDSPPRRAGRRPVRTGSRDTGAPYVQTVLLSLSQSQSMPFNCSMLPLLGRIAALARCGLLLRSIVIYLSVWLSVRLSITIVSLQKRLNGSCRGSGWAKEPCVRCGSRSPQVKNHF